MKEIQYMLVSVGLLTTAQMDTVRHLRELYPTMTIEQAKKEDNAYFEKNAYKVGYGYQDIASCPFYRRCEVIKMLKKQEKFISKR